MKKTDPIQQTIEAALKEAELHDPSSEDYTTIARNVETLAKAKALGESKKLSKGCSNLHGRYRSRPPVRATCSRQLEGVRFDHEG